jgi:preprotein translocase subunit SecA
MPLLDAWKRIAFDTKGEPVKHVWDDYLAKEKALYAGILKENKPQLAGTVKELADQHRMSTVQMCAFFDGIHECVDKLPVVAEMEETTEISITIEWERLYKQMVEYKAEALYSLAEWDNIFPKERQKELYVEQKKSHTIVRNEDKVGRNDACPCGSGKKYKKCCVGGAATPQA